MYKIDSDIKILLVSSIILLSLIFLSCSARNLKTSTVNSVDMASSYSVIFYGNNYVNDPKTAVFFDRAGDQYAFVPNESKYNYFVKKGMEAEDAFKAGREFVGRHSSYFSGEIKAVHGPDGQVVGYEMRPLYHSYRFGRSDILFISYWMKDDDVMLRIEFDKRVGRGLFEKNSSF